MEPVRNKRYAFEWFMRAQDEWYWKRTQRLVEEKKKKTATIAVTSVVVSGIAIIISVFSLLHKS